MTAPTRTGLGSRGTPLGAHRRTALDTRLRTVARTLQLAAPASAEIAELVELVAAAVDDSTEPERSQRIWLILAVVGGRLPDSETVVRAARRVRLDGARAVVAAAVAGARAGWPVARGAWPEVAVVSDATLVDLHHTARTDLATGIQRVARQSAQRWDRDHDIVLIGWNASLRSLRPLGPAERTVALHGRGAGTPPAPEPTSSAAVLVPWRCTYVLPELMTEPPRSRALQAVLRFSGSTGAMIGFDCVPLTSAETTADGMGAAFSLMLTAMAHGHRIAAISLAAATEYRGWRTMLSGAGLVGPAIAAVPLPVDAPDEDPAATARARDLLLDGDAPMLLCVGSHEPRKNHLAVLHAAELLWRDGLDFSLVFVGGNGWHGEQFASRLEQLREQGRPVRSLHALSDELLWAAYRLARAVVFPSLNEGFGLPVAEALASGTPVLTSDFGSMREIAAEGGALLVDPRDDHAIADGLRRLVTDDDLHTRLSDQARRRTRTGWDHYAGQAWDYLVVGTGPTAPTPDGELGDA